MHQEQRHGRSRQQTCIFIKLIRAHYIVADMENAGPAKTLRLLVAPIFVSKLQTHSAAYVAAFHVSVFRAISILSGTVWRLVINIYRT